MRTLTAGRKRQTFAEVAKINLEDENDVAN